MQGGEAAGSPMQDADKDPKDGIEGKEAYKKLRPVQKLIKNLVQNLHMEKP